MLACNAPVGSDTFDGVFAICSLGYLSCLLVRWWYISPGVLLQAYEFADVSPGARISIPLLLNAHAPGALRILVRNCGISIDMYLSTVFAFPLMQNHSDTPRSACTIFERIQLCFPLI